MPIATRKATRRLLLLGAGVALACGERAPQRGDVTPADFVAGRLKAFEHFESPNGRFAIDFPDTWRGGYRAVERRDTTLGARFSVEFVFKPEAAWKVQPHTLLVVRIFPKARWEQLIARPGPAFAARVAERGDDVFALSVPASNPYKPGTSAATRFDELVLAVMQSAVPLRLTPK